MLLLSLQRRTSGDNSLLSSGRLIFLKQLHGLNFILSNATWRPAVGRFVQRENNLHTVTPVYFFFFFYIKCNIADWDNNDAFVIHLMLMRFNNQPPSLIYYYSQHLLCARDLLLLRHSPTSDVPDHPYIPWLTAGKMQVATIGADVAATRKLHLHMGKASRHRLGRSQSPSSTGFCPGTTER